MAMGAETSSFDSIIDPLFSLFTTEQARQIVAYRADSQLEERIEALSQKATAGELSEQERAEYEGYARASRFIAIMQVKAQKQLRETSR